MKIALGEKSFRQRLNALLHSKGISSFANLAGRLRIDPSTVTRNVKQLWNNKDFYSAFALSLAQILEIPTNELRASLLDETSDSAYKEDVEEEISRLKRGDQYIFITSDYPWEFDRVNQRFRSTIVDALREGVIIRYIFPDPGSKEVARTYRNYYPNLLWKTLMEAFKEFKDQIKEKYEVEDRKLNNLYSSITDDAVMTDPFRNLIVIATHNDELDDAVDVTAYQEWHDSTGSKSWKEMTERQSQALWIGISNIKIKGD